MATRLIVMTLTMFVERASDPDKKLSDEEIAALKSLTKQAIEYRLFGDDPIFNMDITIADWKLGQG